MLNKNNIHQRVVEKIQQKKQGINKAIEKNKKIDTIIKNVEEATENNHNIPNIRKMIAQKKARFNELEKIENKNDIGEKEQAKQQGQNSFLSFLPEEKLSEKEKKQLWKIRDMKWCLERGTIWAGQGCWLESPIETPDDYVRYVIAAIEETENKFKNLSDEEKQEFHRKYEWAIENTKAALKGFGLEAVRHNKPEIAKDILEYLNLLKEMPLIDKQLKKQIKRNDIEREKALKAAREEELNVGRKIARFAYRDLTGKKSEETRPGYCSAQHIWYFGYERPVKDSSLPIQTPEDYINAIQLKIQIYKKLLQDEPDHWFPPIVLEEAKASLEEFGLEAMKYNDAKTHELVEKTLKAEYSN